MTLVRTGWILAASLTLTLCLLPGRDERTSNELPRIDYHLVIIDSIGVESGVDSNYVLVWPQAVAHTPSGDIAVLDFQRCNLSLFNAEGDFIRTVGSEGEGPGRFMTPMSMCFYSDGSFLVECQNGVSRFDGEYEFVGRMDWPRGSPSLLAGLDDGGLVGWMLDIDRVEERVLCSITLGRWSGPVEPEVTYHVLDWEMPMPHADGSIELADYRRTGIIACASRRTGRVFYSIQDVDHFEIHGCQPDGTPFLHIEDPDYSAVRKTDEELQVELERRTSESRRLTGLSRVIRPDPCRMAIRSMFIDGEERLWVRLGYYREIVFRVYDMEGNILFHAMLDYPGDVLNLWNWVFQIDEGGFLAFVENPEECPRVYMLELVEAEKR